MRDRSTDEGAVDALFQDIGDQFAGRAGAQHEIDLGVR